MVPTKDDTPHVPISGQEIVNQILEVAALGITSVHLHARRKDQKPAWEREFYLDIISQVRESNEELVICVTTSGRLEPELNKRADVLNLEGRCLPEMASLTLSSMNFAKSASTNAPNTVQSLAKRMLEKGIKPEFEIFDSGMVNYLHYLISKRLVKPPYVVNFILGGLASAQADALELGNLVSRLPGRTLWMAGGIGKAQLPAIGLALSNGGGIRVGIEDNIWWDTARTRLATNFDLVQRAIQIGELMGKSPMTPKEFRTQWLSE